ncbi:hypothetical protein Nepgr_011796 [Nepenthes gracilis]|uniref:Myb-like domain-containing protein n=1 Tax=Nepenthes gracilis TaxID=150966 RepID=A0AAD3SFR1_NEPGR|nr:hypothetical protein Nepgr_011796 [Nepenthes gracilis]
MDMEDQYHQYAMPTDLRHLISTTNRSTSSQFPPLPQPPADLFSAYRGLMPPPVPHFNHHSLEMLVMGRHLTDMLPRAGGSSAGVSLHEFHSDSTATTTTAATNTTVVTTNSGGVNVNFSGFDVEAGGSAACLCLDGGTGRWPRQETLTLLEIRSRLDHKFKEANQKGPLWDEVSRIMYEEHGYQRNGKKCREKFENLYKYYKKTKDGKAGRQDGKHYRFFRQLEALYGETRNAGSFSYTHFAENNNNNTLRVHHNAATTPSDPSQLTAAFHQPAGISADSLSSLSNSSNFDTLSSDDHDEIREMRGLTVNVLGKKKTRRGKQSARAKIKEFIDSQMTKLMEKQEAWMEKMMMTLEHKEQERMERAEEWRKQEAERMEREHEFWASERAWMEARDAALMHALQKVIGTRAKDSSSDDVQSGNGDHRVDVDMDRWPEPEVTRLINLRRRMNSKFQQCGSSLEDQNLWREIASEMACLGFSRSAFVCKEKWDSISKYLRTENEYCNEKRKQNRRSNVHNGDNNVFCQGRNGHSEMHEQGAAPVNCSLSNVNAMDDSCFRFLIGEGENMWENCGVKMMNKGEN